MIARDDVFALVPCGVAAPPSRQPAPYSVSGPSLCSELGIIASELSAPTLEKLVVIARRLRDEEAGQ
jgi:hypothetical protein